MKTSRNYRDEIAAKLNRTLLIITQMRDITRRLNSAGIEPHRQLMLPFPRKDGFSPPFCKQVASCFKGCFIRCARCGGLLFTRQRARRVKF